MPFELVREETRQILKTGQPDAATSAANVWRSFLAGDRLSPRDRGRALCAWGQMLAMDNRTNEARDLYIEALGYVSEPEDRLAVLCAYAQVVVKLNSAELAEVLADELELCVVHRTGSCAFGFAALSSMLTLLNRTADAITAAQSGLNYLESVGVTAGRAECWSALAEANALHGEKRSAIAAYEEAMVYMSAGHCLMGARAEHGTLALQVGDLQTAKESLGKAVEFADLRDRRVLARVHRALVELGKVDPVAAVQLLEVLAAHLESA